MKQVLGLLQKKDVDVLFNENSIFIYDSDVVPIEVANELFNIDCQEGLKRGEWDAIYSRTGGLLRYLTKAGFEKIVTYHNIDLFNKLLMEQE